MPFGAIGGNQVACFKPWGAEMWENADFGHLLAIVGWWWVHQVPMHECHWPTPPTHRVGLGVVGLAPSPHCGPVRIYFRLCKIRHLMQLTQKDSNVPSRREWPAASKLTASAEVQLVLNDPLKASLDRSI